LESTYLSTLRDYFFMVDTKAIAVPPFGEGQGEQATGGRRLPCRHRLVVCAAGFIVASWRFHSGMNDWDHRPAAGTIRCSR
jgi:hypothetical protein